MLGKMSVTERLRLAQTQDGLNILANVDPSQLPGLFPRYYQEKLPDVGKALKSVMSDEFKPLSRREANQQMSVDQLDKSGSKFDPSTGKKTSTVAAKEKLASLSDEQKKVYEELKNGQVSADDPRLKFLEKISPEDLKKAGIEKITGEDGKLSYKGTQIPEVEIERRMQMGDQTQGSIKPGYEQSGLSAEAIKNYIRQEATKRNIDPEAAVKVASTEGMGQYQSGVINKKGERERSYGPFQLYMGGGLGNSFKKDTGIDPGEDSSARSVKMQIQYALDHAAKQGNWDAWHGVRDNRLPRDMGLSRDSRAVGTSEPEIGTALTPEQAAQQVHQQRQTSLAGSISSVEEKEKQTAQVQIKGSGGTDPQSRERATTGQTIYTAGDSIGVGVGQSNKTPSVAQGGLMFTDPRMVQQLKNVPQGSTVQLYAGTNDAASNRLDSKAYEARMAELKQIAEERGLNVSIHGPHQSNGKQWSGNVGTVNQLLGDSARTNGFRYVDNSSVTADAQDGVHMSKRAYQDLYTRGMPQPEPQTGEPIPAMADGGEANVNEGEIKALPIGAMKNDNSVVVDKDSKPLFTMNTKEESANYNPDTGKVSVDPNAKKENDGNQELSLEQQAQFKQSQVPIPESSGMSSFDTTLTLTDNIFKDPSFHRAMSRARFDISGDSASGNHFSSSATVS
jgi:hypothetical protein